MADNFHQKIYSIGAPYLFASAIFAMIAFLVAYALAFFETGTLFPLIRFITVCVMGLLVVYFSSFPFSALTLVFGVLKAAAVAGALWYQSGEIAELAVLMFALLGLLEYVVTAKIRRALAQRMAAVPATARIIDAQGERQVPISQLHAGDVVMVREGERIPADGVVEEGEALTSEYALSGETRQTLKRMHDFVYASAINESGVLRMRVTAAGGETVLAKTVGAIAAAARAETKPMRAMTTAGIGLAAVTAVLSLMFLFVFQDVPRALALALVVGAGYASVFVPAATVYAILEAAGLGFLMRSAKDIKDFASATRIVLDTTKQVSYSERTVASVRMFWGAKQDDVFSLASGLYAYANDRYSLVVCEEARKRNIAPVKPKKLEVAKGKGVKATVDGVIALVGSEAFIRANNVHIQEEVKEHIGAEMKAGLVPLLAVRDHKILGVLSLSDTLQPSLKAALTDLADHGVKSVFMTKKNDEEGSKGSVELGPERIRAMRHEKEVVIALGDGIEDADVLAAAQVGVVVQATDKRAALEGLHRVLFSVGFENLPRVVARSKRVMGVFKQSTVAWGILTALGIGAVLAGAIGPLGAALWYLLSECVLLLSVARLFPKKESERLSFY